MTQVTTSATYKTLVTADLPDFGSRDITFRLVAAFFNAAGEEVIDGTTYTMTLDVAGNDDGAFYLPTPDNTGAAGANWFVTLPSGFEDIVTVAYSGTAQAVSDLLAAGSTTTDPDVILAALLGKVNRTGDTMSGSLTGYFLQHTTIPAGETITIPATAQLIVAGGITVDGTLVQDGPLVVIPDDALSAANDLSDLNDAATARTNLGLGSAATASTAAFDAAGTAAALVDDLSGVTNAATARTNLGLGTMATAAAADYILKDAAILSKSAGYQLAAGDEAKIIECDGTFTITLPNGLDAGFQATIVNVGSGTITLAAATTLQSAGTQLATQYTAATVYHRGSNIWLAFGRLT